MLIICTWVLLERGTVEGSGLQSPQTFFFSPLVSEANASTTVSVVTNKIKAVIIDEENQ